MEENLVLLKTDLGQLRGQSKTSIYFNKIYYAFRGIPYGKPPIGDLRFKAPQPYGGWEGVRDALKDGNSAMQPSSLVLPPLQHPSKVSFGDEDCLYLNVYMNQLPETISSKKPVMFFIHGGGFLGGSGGFHYFGPDFIMNEDVVLVAINYRCGPFGFLSLENEEVPGNAGLKDQTLALQWVKDNIHSFGGDPNNVTIFGISAGGASTHYHLLSHTSKGLFHKAIIQSGFSNNIWALQPRPRKMAIKLAKVLGFSSENDSEILQFLQSVTADDIIVATKNIVLDLKEVMESFSIIFTPCVEVAGTNPFLTDTPENLMKKGQFHKVPVIIGCSGNEGSISLIFNVIDKDKFEKLKETPELLVPQSLNIENNKIKEAGQRIWDFYFKEKAVPWEEQNKNFLTYASDVYFNHGMEKTRIMFLEMSPFPVFSYMFTNHTRCLCSVKTSEVEDGKKEDRFVEPVSKETCHGADTLFITVFRYLHFPELTPEHKEAISKYNKAWCTFASTSDPNCEELGDIWEKDSIANPCFMDIGATWTMKKGIPFAERVDFWKKLAEKYSSC